MEGRVILKTGDGLKDISLFLRYNLYFVLSMRE